MQNKEQIRDFLVGCVLLVGMFVFGFLLLIWWPLVGVGFIETLWEIQRTEGGRMNVWKFAICSATTWSLAMGPTALLAMIEQMLPEGRRQGDGAALLMATLGTVLVGLWLLLGGWREDGPGSVFFGMMLVCFLVAFGSVRERIGSIWDKEEEERNRQREREGRW